MCFIPGANLLLIGYLWGFALKGWAGLGMWHQYITPACAEFIQNLIKQVQQLF